MVVGAFLFYLFFVVPMTRTRSRTDSKDQQATGVGNNPQWGQPSGSGRGEVFGWRSNIAWWALIGMCLKSHGCKKMVGCCIQKYLAFPKPPHTHTDWSKPSSQQMRGSHDRDPATAQNADYTHTNSRHKGYKK